MSAYTKSEEFEKYFIDNDIQVNPNYGFIHITLNNKYYFPGQMVRGRVFVHLCQKIKTSQAILKISAEENVVNQSGTKKFSLAQLPIVGVTTPKLLEKPEPIVKRQTFKEEMKKRQTLRKKSVILDLPVINVLKASDDSEMTKSNNLASPLK